MAKSQPKIDDIKDLKKATVTSDGLMSKEDKTKIDTLINRTIKVEGYDKAGSATTIPLNFKSGDGVINIEGKVNSGILDIIFSSVNTLSIYGALDPQDLRDTTTGIYELVEGNLYYFAPNPICGTDADSDSLYGKLIVLENIDETSKTLYYHSYKTNKIHVCSGYDNEGVFVWKNWERLLTCMDEPQTIQADIEAESIYHLPIPATGTTDYTFYLNGFDGKNGNKIEIDLATIAGSVNMNKRVVEIYVSPAQPNIDVSFYCAGLNSFTPTASYTDPLLVSGNIYYMKFIFLKQTTYWSVDNNIAYF